jgi:hypothetical protein
MKNAIYPLLILVFWGICFSISPKTVKPLELTESQLRDLGFTINEKGIFLKTVIPENDTDRKVYDYMRGYVNSKIDRSTRYRILVNGIRIPEDLSKIDNSDYFDSIPPLICDYFFVKILESNDSVICSLEPRDAEVIPILVRQSQYDFMIKNDVIFFMIASEGLKQKLSYIKNLKDYIIKLPED